MTSVVKAVRARMSQAMSSKTRPHTAVCFLFVGLEQGHLRPRTTKRCVHEFQKRKPLFSKAKRACMWYHLGSSQHIQHYNYQRRVQEFLAQGDSGPSTKKKERLP